MYDNAKIPQRSVLLIVDDRHFAEYFNDHFRPYVEQWGWPVVNGYIGVDERTDLWAENAALSAEGWVDYQAHGYLHNTPISEGSSDEFITSEMQGAINSIQKYMNKTPIGYIWPGGGFSKRAVEIGTTLGYKLGFTVNPRAPVMYNWVPQADTINDSNPYAIPETPAGNPLMTLPRYWSTDVDLTPKEFHLLQHFLLHPEEVVRRTELLEKVWDMHLDPESNVVDVHVGNVRRKLRKAVGENLIQTVRGVGFSLRRERGAEVVDAAVS